MERYIIVSQSTLNPIKSYSFQILISKNKLFAQMASYFVGFPKNHRVKSSVNP